MEISAHNAFVLYKAKSIQGKFDTYYKFFLELAGQLCRSQFEAESSDDDGDLQPPPPRKLEATLQTDYVVDTSVIIWNFSRHAG